MSGCERLSDRMPEVAMRRAAWSAEEAEHLGACADCRAEWELMLAARRLEARAPAVNVDLVAAGVQRRLAAQRKASRRARWLWTAAGSAAAAAAVAIAVATGPASGPDGGTPVVARAEALVPLPELEGLETAELDTLLQALDGPLAGSSTLESSTMSDDVDAELERILATSEG